MLIAVLTNDQDCRVGSGTHGFTYEMSMKDYLDYGTVTSLCTIHFFEVLHRMEQQGDLRFKWKSTGGTGGYLVYRPADDLLR